MNVSTLEQMESDWNQPVRRVQLVWEELSLTAKLQQLLKTWGHLVMDQGRTPGSQKMLLRLFMSISWCPALHLGHSE